MTHPIALGAEFPEPSRTRNFLERMQRLDAKRGQTRRCAFGPTPSPDAELFALRRPFDDAWAVEIEKMILMKRTRTPEAIATAKLASLTVRRIVRSIEMAEAWTLEGAKVKARAALWRRHGEPLPAKRSRSAFEGQTEKDQLSAAAQ